MMRSQALVLSMLLLVCQSAGAEAASAGDANELAKQILVTTGVQAGFVLHIGCGDGELTAALAADERYVVHGMDVDAANVAKARKLFDDRGLAGRVTAGQFAGERLPLVDNVVNLLVSDNLGKVSMGEVLRVLVPGGIVALEKDGQWQQTVKPRPKEIDAWTHYLHGPDGNAVAHDARVGPPRRLQWMAGPMFARHHDVLASVSALVSDGPRVFYIMDEGPASLMHFPPKWRLIARDAFNGVLLWKKPIPTWADYLRPFRSGPPQLPRRLVAVGDRVYVTLGLDAPVSVLDAATGRVLETCEATRGADEILLLDDVLLVVTCDFEAADSSQATRRGVPPAGSPRSLLAVATPSGQVLWQKTGAETAAMQPMSLAAGGNRVVFQRGDQVVCLDLKTGEKLWTFGPSAPPTPAAARTSKRRPKERPSARTGPLAPTLVISEKNGVVLAADKGKLTALSLDQGKPLWSCSCPYDFHAPADLFVADGLVWAGLFATQGRDPKSGEIKRTLDLEDLLVRGHHPRCYRNKATDRFIITGKHGYEFIDLTGNAHSRNNWARGGCQYGMMPSNGLTYMPPNACCCYPGAMLHGFYALAGRQDTNVTGPGGDALHRGPAYDAVVDADPDAVVDADAGATATKDPWPTLRGNATRSGSTSASLAISPEKLWEAEVGGKLSTLVVGGGKVFVASVNRRRITALNAASGETAWTFTAGGRVDTPPTIYQGLAIFGAADGWVYCLRASDGALVWRVRAAPEDRRTVVDNQLESLWPVHGNVLVLEGVAYFAAGRSPYLDGGIYLYGVDCRTGKKQYETRVIIPHSEDECKTFIMAGVRPDILVTDGKYVYLQQIKFDRHLVRQKDLGRHLICTSGLADDSWFYRTFWRLGYGDAYDFPFSYIKHTLRVPFGQLLVFDERFVCGLQTFMSPGIVPSLASESSRGCQVFGDPNAPFSPDEKTDPDSDFPAKAPIVRTPRDHQWTAKLPFQARAMLLAGNALFVAGWPDADSSDPYAARDGREGGRLWVFSPSDGKKLATHELESSPVFDGMAAAGGRLFIAMKNGKVTCFGKSQ